MSRQCQEHNRHLQTLVPGSLMEKLGRLLAKSDLATGLLTTVSSKRLKVRCSLLPTPSDPLLMPPLCLRHFFLFCHSSSGTVHVVLNDYSLVAVSILTTTRHDATVFVVAITFPDNSPIRKQGL